MTDFQRKKQEIFDNKAFINYGEIVDLQGLSKALDQLYETREQEIRIKAFNNGAKVTRAKILKELLKRSRTDWIENGGSGWNEEYVPAKAIKELLG